MRFHPGRVAADSHVEGSQAETPGERNLLDRHSRGGLLAAIFVLPEVYGYIEVRAAARDSAPSSSAPSTLSTVKPAA